MAGVVLGGFLVGYMGELIAADEFASPRQQLSLPAFAFGAIVLKVFGVARLLLDGGVVPRLWVWRRGEEVTVASLCSLLTGRGVRGSDELPLQFSTGTTRTRRDRKPYSGLIVLSDGRKHVSVAFYDSNPRRYTRRLRRTLEHHGVPMKSSRDDQDREP